MLKSQFKELSTVCKNCKEKVKIRAKGLCDKCYHRFWRGKHPKRHWCYQTIYTHKRRGFEIVFSRDELYNKVKNVSHCKYCNQPLYWRYNYGMKLNSPTLDRINNDEILTLENTVVVCWYCNNAKGNKTLKEWLNYMEIILARLK